MTLDEAPNSPSCSFYSSQQRLVSSAVIQKDPSSGFLTPDRTQCGLGVSSKKKDSRLTHTE